MNFSEINPALTYNRASPMTTGNLYAMDSQQNYNNGTYSRSSKDRSLKPEALRGNTIDSSELSDLFFSTENVKRIQKKIRQEIYSRTKGQYKLDIDQDEADLLIAMRAVFLSDAKHLPKHIVRQVKILNNKTVNYIVPDMITNIKQYFGYIKDINQPLKPIQRPINVNNAGRRTLPSITTIWTQ